MNTILNPVIRSYRIKGSRFHGYLFPATSPEEFQNRLNEVMREHPSATHYCYAWRIGVEETEEFTQDDGEPPGTAGLPILNRLLSADLIQTGLVVVRYYGGTNLGKSGLIESYAHTAQHCIDHARRVRLVRTRLFRITYPYDQQNLYEKWKRDFRLIEKESEYLERVTVTVALPLDTSPDFRSTLQQSVHLVDHFEELGSSTETESLLE